MADKSTLEKLRLLLPHWLAHNHSHLQEFARWTEAVRNEGEPELAALLDRAMAGMRETDAALDAALARMGGPTAEGGHQHHHRHHHD